MQIRYDRVADALYIRLVSHQIAPGAAVETVEVTHRGVFLSILVDLDKTGLPIGIEILSVASRGLEGDRVIVEPVSDRVVSIESIEPSAPPER